MDINSHNMTPTIKCRLRTPRLVIIEFILEELPDISTPGQMLYLSLAPNYLGDKKDLHHEIIRFDLKSEDAIQEHMAHVSDRVRALNKMYVFSPPPFYFG